jgi:hypothetical protein
MKTDKILFYIFIILPFNVIAQEVKELLEINKFSNYYYINDNPIFCITYELIKEMAIISFGLKTMIYQTSPRRKLSENIFSK